MSCCSRTGVASFNQPQGHSKARGDIFKACHRLGEKEGVDIWYDLRKMKFFIEDLIEMHERGEHLNGAMTFEEFHKSVLKLQFIAMVHDVPGAGFSREAAKSATK